MEKSLKNTKKPMGLSTKIFIALIAGAISGVLIHYFMPAGYIRDSVIVEGVLYVIGQGFIRLMQMLVVPLVFCSLICGSMAIGDTKTLGKVGIKTILFYLLLLLLLYQLHYQLLCSSILVLALQLKMYLQAV